MLTLTAGIPLVACSGQKAPSPPDAAAQLRRIAAADPAKYPNLQEGKHWSNPYLVIRPQAVALLTSVSGDEEQLLKPDEVLNVLAQLPASAWPYGRVVAILVEEKTSASEPEKIAVRRNRGIVAGELQEAGVAILWMPGS